MRAIKLVATDLDGTLLRDDKTISKEDLATLSLLGEKQIIRVVATGRNLTKIKHVIPDLSYFDYLVFSSGAGIYDCRNDKLLYSKYIDQDIVSRLNCFFIERNIGFFLYKAIPGNEYCWYYRGKKKCEEYEYYYELHRHVLEELPGLGKMSMPASQYLIIFETPEQFMDLQKSIECCFDQLKILRASSPYLTGYTWMEIFNQDVSKGNAVRFLCDYLKVDQEATIGIGNDYNDIDLLEFTSYSYLVDNSPEELKQGYLSAPGNEESAFSYCIKCHLNA